MPLIAHAADWIGLLFLVPVIAFFGWVALARLRQREGGAGDESSEIEP